MKWEVKYVHVIEREITCTVEAMDEVEAIKKAIEGDYIESDEDNMESPEQGIEIKNEKAKLLSGFTEDLEEL